MAYTIDDELRPQSAYSPGVVQDEEELLRIIFYPEHIVDNIVQPSAIATRHYATEHCQSEESSTRGQAGRLHCTIAMQDSKRYTG